MQALANNFTVINSTFYENDDQPNDKCPNYVNKHEINETWAKDCLDKTSQFTRIYVFFGTENCLRFFMGEMRDEGLFSDSKLPEDRYVVIQVETNVENPDLFEYIWDKKDIFEYKKNDTNPKFVKNCEKMAEDRVDQLNQWESLIVVSIPK